MLGIPPKPLGISPKDLGEPPKAAAMPHASAIVGEMEGIVRAAVDPHRPDGIKVALARAARTLNLPARRVRAYWHGEVRSVRADEADHLRRVHRELLAAELRRLDAQADLLRARLRECRAP